MASRRATWFDLDGEDADDLCYWATRIGGRYMGADLAEAYGKHNGVKGELLVSVTSTKIVAGSSGGRPRSI